MKSIFDEVSAYCSRKTTTTYSTSFSWGIKLLHDPLRVPIYSIYGFVRFADEIVDSFSGYDQRNLLDKFKSDTYEAIESGISLNPILNSFQAVYHKFNIDKSSVDLFFESMEMDLDRSIHNQASYEAYILGSAEVVGLMCLRVFCNGEDEGFLKLRPYAMRLGSAFQKINFLRDASDDQEQLGRTYFPDVDFRNLSLVDKARIEEEIQTDFDVALQGIKMLPASSRKGVYLAYIYYQQLLKKIRKAPPQTILNTRIRVKNRKKLTLIVKTLLKFDSQFSTC